MRRGIARVTGAVGVATLVVAMGTAWAAPPRIVMTVNELIHHERRLEVEPGTEVIWSDVHFERVWFPRAREVQVERAPEGFRTVFEKAGVYHGLYTIVGGHTSGDVYRMTVTVKKRAD